MMVMEELTLMTQVVLGQLIPMNAIPLFSVTMVLIMQIQKIH
jgi:hypothetical protein